jgi:hypothetical protein
MATLQLLWEGALPKSGDRELEQAGAFPSDNCQQGPLWGGDFGALKAALAGTVQLVLRHCVCPPHSRSNTGDWQERSNSAQCPQSCLPPLSVVGVGTTTQNLEEQQLRWLLTALDEALQLPLPTVGYNSTWDRDSSKGINTLMFRQISCLKSKPWGTECGEMSSPKEPPLYCA